MVSEKIKTVIQLQEILGDLKKSGKKIGVKYNSA